MGANSGDKGWGLLRKGNGHLAKWHWFRGFWHNNRSGGHIEPYSYSACGTARVQDTATAVLSETAPVPWACARCYTSWLKEHPDP